MRNGREFFHGLPKNLRLSRARRSNRPPVRFLLPRPVVIIMARRLPRIRGPRFELQPKNQMIEHELVDRCRRGERSAQHEIYTRTVDRVYRLILRITGNHDDAFDLVQETYIRAFTRANQFDGRSSFETWLTRIAINQALQNKRRVSLGERTIAAMNGRNKSPAPHPPHDQKIDVDDALALLPEAERALLVLRYQEGLDYAAIADVTGCPPGTVASRLNRARERVRELLKESYAPREENPYAVHPMSRSNKGSAQPAAEVPAPRLQRGAEP